MRGCQPLKTRGTDIDGGAYNGKCSPEPSGSCIAAPSDTHAHVLETAQSTCTTEEVAAKAFDWTYFTRGVRSLLAMRSSG